MPSREPEMHGTERLAQGAEAPNPVHMATAPETRWTTVNFAEAVQGVQTPFSWGFWDYALEIAGRRAFGDIGVFSLGEVEVPGSADERITGVFYGRVAGNLEIFRRIGNRMPGTSADLLEEKIFGIVHESPSGTPLRDRLSYPRVLAKLPLAARRAGRAMPRMLDEYRSWWRSATLDSPPSELEAAQRLILESARRFTEVEVHETIVSLLAPQLLEGLIDLARNATGDPGLGQELATGFGGMEETQIISDLWAASRGELELTEIRRSHGFHAPDEGRLEARSWREDPTPVEAIIAGYAERGVADPRERERERIARRERAIGRVLSGLPAHKRPSARFAIRLASTFIPIREVGKAAYLHAIDAARCGARVAGGILAERGLLADPEDVFFLTFHELIGTPDASFAEKVAERRARHERYLGLDLPSLWQGPPEPIDSEARASAGDDEERPRTLHGIGVVGDVVTGRARIVSDPGAAALEPGDILVCATTDPSWTPLFMLADALVIDIGGEISHGAIVARELGVPCVINTVSGTRDIPEGATITVDARAGTIDVAS